jgi:hypothetical protein
MSAPYLQFLIAGSMILSSLAFAEDDESLDVFGYFQGVGQYTMDDGLLNAGRKNLNFKNQTLNIFLAKDLGEDFRALVNTEYLNNVNTSEGMGAIKLEEAWLAWQPSDLMRLRLGKQIPIFNSFNEIKNKMVLHPYMFRPIMYEASLENDNLDLKSWVPREAYVQVDGNYYIDDHEFQYALFWGNSDLFEKNFNASDTSKYSSFGGRLGYANSDFGIKMGVSGTIDRETFIEVNWLKGYVLTPFQAVMVDTLQKTTVLKDKALSGLAQANSGIAKLEAGIGSINEGLAGHAQIDAQIANLDPTSPAYAPTVAGLEAARAQQIPLSAAELTAQKTPLEAQLAGAIAGRTQAEEGLVAAGDGIIAIEAQIDAFESILAASPPSAKRYRIGFDFTWESEFGTIFNAEYVKVYTYFDDDNDEKAYSDMRDQVNGLAAQAKLPPQVLTDLTRKSMYFSLGQKLGEQWFVFAKTSRLVNKQMANTSTGLINYGFGLTYNPIFPVTFKAQYAFWGVQKENDNFIDIAEITEGNKAQLNVFFVGASVMF